MRQRFPVRPAALVAFIFIVVLALACGGGDGLQNDGTEGPTAAVSVSAGTFHTCAVTAEGGVKCWGSNNLGQLGDGTLVKRRTAPVDVVGLSSDMAAVSAGELHTCALSTTGGVKCWGSNINGQLGDGTNTDRNTPVDVVGLTSGVAAISASRLQTCALTTAGGLKCWGVDSSGQLGDGAASMQHRTEPVDVVGFDGR